MAQLPNPEIRPAVDEQPPVIGPNLAEDVNLAGEVTKYVVSEYWYPQELLLQPFWSAWKRIDQAWRARVLVQDSNVSSVNHKTIETLNPSEVDGRSMKGQSVMTFKQMHAITDIAEQLSWQDGAPFRVQVPEDVVEDDFYRPSDEAARAANSLLRQNADEIDMRTSYRKNIGAGFIKYGFSWAMCDFEKREEDVMVRYALDMQNPAIAEQQFAMVAQRYPGSSPRIVSGPDGVTYAVVMERKVEKFTTHFRHLPVEAVFFDPLVSCTPVECQPCPMVREHVTNAEIEGNPYRPETNPFGYVNIRAAIDNTKGQYALSSEDEGVLREKLKNRYNISDQTGGGPREERIKQRWTAFPLLRIHEGKLDTGDGIECPACNGRGAVPSETGDAPCGICGKSGKVHPPLKRYVAVFYGNMRGGSTCIRLQELPKGMDVPLLYAADLVEDDSCAIPMSKAEIALIPIAQLTLSETQFHNSKESCINRGWKVKTDSPAWLVQNLNKPGAKIPFESSEREATRNESNNFDETATLLPYMQSKEAQIQALFGATDTLLGMVQQGRRSALEIGEATQAAKNPLVLMVDRYNCAMIGGWAKKALRNMELFGDRDFIRRKTGREFFGKVRIFTAVGQEFVKKLAAEQNLRWVLQAAPAIPALQPAMPAICNKLFAMMGIGDIRIPDGGVGKASTDAMRIVSEILGSGMMIPPLPDEPHEIYLGVFNGAIKDPYWQTNAPQNLFLLAQRIGMQQQMLIQQQMQQLQAQMAMQAPMESGRKNQPPGPKEPATTLGEEMQHAQG